MPLLAPTKGQKNAAKRAAKRQGASATKEAPSGKVEYAIVGNIEPERLDLPAIAFTPTQESATSTRNVAVSLLEHYSLTSYEDIVAAPSIPTTSQQVPQPNTDLPRSQSSGSPPTLSTLPLESLGSFSDSFTFTAPTGIGKFGERSNTADFSDHEYASSFSKDVEDFAYKSPTSLGFSEASVEDLRSPTFTTAAASTRAFEAALSRTSGTIESSISTWLGDATTANAPASVCEDDFPCPAADIWKQPEVSSDYANREQALVPYCRLKPLTVDYEANQDLDENNIDLSLEGILPGRMFLASADGMIQCIAHDQFLHNVETIKDDGGSDFDSVASPSKGYLADASEEYNETFESIDSRIEDAQLGPSIREKLHDIDNAGVEGPEVPDRCLQPANKYNLDREELSSHTDGSNAGSDEAASVSTEKCEVIGTHQGRLESTTRPDSKEEIHDAPMNEVSDEELAETVSTSSQVPDTPDCASELSRMRLGTESLSSFLEVMEAEESGKATRHAVVTAFLKLVNIERKKRGVHALPSLYTAHSVLSSSILPHTIMLGTTTVASLLAQLSFDDRDEVEIVDVCAAWDRLSHEEVQQ
ncbi:hypothetical protein J4E93_006696 [Alternaria ventricosa]|uniref:uncharacterized protein n=1 Tax=Alternaria ventricosa TaxID=1187951 RepID=UPI0020C26F11|nr:uncharacterized protein J4E93_006696 [Alternaria ventricosa]KAI4643684.1 hypothetical protein J4E93_006696 [Alternaria ventricosa]